MTTSHDPAPKDYHEKMRLRKAAYRVKHLYPGPVGELLSQELYAWEEFGFRFGGGSLIRRVVDHILEAIDRGDAA